MSLCESCGTYLPSGNFHHRAAKGMGGSGREWIHDPSNLLYLCGMGNVDGCHGRAHQVPEFAMALGLIVSRFSPYVPGEIPVRLHDGMWWLNSDGSRTRAVITKETA